MIVYKCEIDIMWKVILRSQWSELAKIHPDYHMALNGWIKKRGKNVNIDETLCCAEKSRLYLKRCCQT